MPPQSTAQGWRGQLCSQLGPVPTAAALGGPAVTLEPSHPAWEGSAAALPLPGTASWSLARVLFQHGTLPCQIKYSDSISLCRYNSRIVPALILDLAFLPQHCHNWCMWLGAEKSIVCFPSPQRPKGLGTECPPPAEAHCTHQHHFMGLYLPLSVHKSACQALPLEGLQQPRAWPCSA